MAKLNEYLTVGEAAELLGVSKDTLRRWDRAGKLKARRHPITGYRLYLKGDLDELLRYVGGAKSTGKRGARQGKRSTKRG